jgi:5-methylcytosine-specific restriction endonuclease McrA
MPTMPPMFRVSGARSKAETDRAADQRRGSAKERGYDGRWAKARASHLARSPLCRYCEVGAFGAKRVTAATIVDHLYPHRGDRALFWQTRFWVSACGDCHAGPKQAVEHRGMVALHALADQVGVPRLGPISPQPPPTPRSKL